jgi:7-cyano-7-deazaguanine tRNA-ribosyltransferase
LGVDSVDSSGWRNRAARGLIQLPGTGDRMVANLGKWRGRKLSRSEWQVLATCSCPACRVSGPKVLTRGGAKGFCARATHNLWVLLEEADWITQAIADETYSSSYQARLDNTIYLALIAELLKVSQRN